MRKFTIIAVMLMASVSAFAQKTIKVFSGIYYPNEIKEIAYGTTKELGFDEPLVQFIYKNGDIDDMHPFSLVRESASEDLEFVNSVFPGGEEELMSFLNRNLKYPVSCQEANISGRVVCSFIVRPNGKVSDVKIISTVHPDLDREARRVIKSMPLWTPATINGTPVSSKYSLPIKFALLVKERKIRRNVMGSNGEMPEIIVTP